MGRPRAAPGGADRPAAAADRQGAELATQDTWRHLRDELERVHLGTFRGAAGVISRRTELSARQRQILGALQVPEPPPFTRLQPALDELA